MSHMQRKEFEAISHSITLQVLRGVIVGVIVGLIVGSFRWLIEQGFERIQDLYRASHFNPSLLGILVLFYGLIIWLSSLFTISERDIKGSGIPQVEAELKGLMSQSWWSVLWKKWVLGVLAIASGLLLGREGPSIQLGAVGGKGLSRWLKLSPVEERTLIASGAAAGLAAAFNAPIAGLLFVVEEVYHYFSRFFWVSTLAASLIANFISQMMFGLTPVLHMPETIPHMGLGHYWLLVLMGLFLGGMGYLYELAVLNIGKVYDWLGELFHVKPAYYPLFAFISLLPLGYVLPQLLGGGNGLVLSLSKEQFSLWLLVLFFLIRFVWSMLGYGSGLPGGIFLPILALGSLLGAIIGKICLELGIITADQLPIFVILGMSGYFGAISKAPLTAMILVTEMVGDIRSLMPLGVVTLFAYIAMDLLKGAPVYEAMLERLMPEQIENDDETTLIEIPVSEKIAGKPVRDLHLPANVLITMQVHQGRNQMVHGATRLYLGDTIYLVVKQAEIGKVKDLLL